MARTDSEYTAIVDNFAEFAKMIDDFQQELITGSDTAESMSRNHGQPKPSGFGFWIQGDLEAWRRKYGDNVVGAAIDEIENDFPELSNPHYFYWTTNEDVQGEIEDFVNRFSAAFEAAADKIKSNVDRIKQEREEQERERREARERARSQAQRARAIEEKYKAVGSAFEAGVSGKTTIGSVFKGIGKAISGFFRRRG